jgi:hypothetical protein
MGVKLMGKDDDELIDSWQEEHLEGRTCPVCEKKLPEGVKHSMLRVFHGRYGARVVAPHGTAQCPTCGATLKLRWGTGLGRTAMVIGFLGAIFFIILLFMSASYMGNNPIMILYPGLAIVSMVAGAGVYRIDEQRNQRVVVVSRKT